MSSQAPLRVGIVGCGAAAQMLHVPSLQSLARRFRIAAVTDASGDVAAAVAERAGARTIADPFELVEDDGVDVVVVCTPDSFHLDHALAACEARRRAVLVEKPMTLNARMGRILADAAEKHGVPVLVGYPHVYDSATQRAREAWGSPGGIRSGEFHCRVGSNDDVMRAIAEPIRPAAPPDPWSALHAQLDSVSIAIEAHGAAIDVTTVVGHGLTLGLSIHDIPLVRRFAGDALEVAWARFRPGPNPLDFAGLGIDAVLTTPTGTIWLQSEFTPLERTDWGFRLHRADLQVEVRFPTTFAAAAPSRCSIYGGAPGGGTFERRYTDHYETGFRRTWLHLHEVVTAGAAPATPARDAVRDLELVEAIASAAHRGRS